MKVAVVRGKEIPSRVAEGSGSWDSHILFVVENWYQLSEGQLAKYVLKSVEILRTILGISLYTSRNLSGTCAKIQVYSSQYFFIIGKTGGKISNNVILANIS